MSPFILYSGQKPMLQWQNRREKEDAHNALSQWLCEISLYSENIELTEKLFQAATYFTLIPFSFQTFEHDQQLQKDFICSGTKFFSTVQL